MTERQAHILLVVICISGVIGDVLMKLAGQQVNVNWKLFFIAYCLYTMNVCLWFFVVRHAKFSSLGCLASICVAVFFMLAGRFYFGEIWTTRQIVGALLAVTSLAIMGF